LDIRCNWLVESHNPDDPPHYCGRAPVARYDRMGTRRGSPVVAQQYHRCARHDTKQAQALIAAHPDEWVREELT